MQVLEAVRLPLGEAPAAVTLDADTQSSILSLLLEQKVDALLTSRESLTEALKHNPPSPTKLTNAIQGIDAEVTLCNDVSNDLENNRPIQFPSAEQIADLSKAVGDLGAATAQGAASVAFISAVNKLVGTFPT